MASPAGAVVAAGRRSCAYHRCLRRASGTGERGPAVWFNRADLRHGASQPGMSCPAAEPRLSAPSAEWRPGRGPVRARRADRDHPYPCWRPLRAQAPAGTVCPGRRAQAGHSPLSSRTRVGHVTSVRPRQHQLR